MTPTNSAVAKATEVARNRLALTATWLYGFAAIQLIAGAIAAIALASVKIIDHGWDYQETRPYIWHGIGVFVASAGLAALYIAVGHICNFLTVKDAPSLDRRKPTTADAATLLTPPRTHP